MSFKKLLWIIFGLAPFFGFSSCSNDDQKNGGCEPPSKYPDAVCCSILEFIYTEQIGCDGQIYLDPATSPYKIPFEKGLKFRTGLTNCSASFHSAGQPDEYAFDFDLPTGTPFIASRSGKVTRVLDDQNSNGGGVGNYVVIDHLDQTFGAYLHSPEGGIFVKEGDNVLQGQKLGSVGMSGQAGYPHLHFIVLRDSFTYPYSGIPISFNNVSPPDVILQGNKEYSACQE